MALNRLGLSDTEIAGLARVAGYAVEELDIELARRPWAIHDVLAAPETVDTVLGFDSLEDSPAPFALFAVLTRLAADDLLTSSYLNDWIGPGSRLPVFDVEPVQEFVASPGRLVFIARLLASMVDPTAAAVPLVGCNPWELVEMVGDIDPDQRALVLRRVGDIALFLAGVHADAIGEGVISEEKAERVGRCLGMTDDEILEMTDPGSTRPGLDALELVCARSYQEARRGATDTPPVVSDVAERIHAARRFLTHLADGYLSPIEPEWPLAA